MTTRRAFALLLLVSLLPATLPAAPTAVEFQGVTIGSKLQTTPVSFKTKVGLAGGGSLAPGLYDVEVASTGDKSRVMLLFFQKGRKMGETPGALKIVTGQGGKPLFVCNGGKPLFLCNAGPAKGSAKMQCNEAPAKGSAKMQCTEGPGKGSIQCNGVAKTSKGGDVMPCNGMPKGAQGAGKRYLSFQELGFAGGVKPSLRAGAGGGTLLTIPGAGGVSVEAELPAAH
jgi:hypothetical protein